MDNSRCAVSREEGAQLFGEAVKKEPPSKGKKGAIGTPRE
jgi:hypothetical protein